MGYTEMSLHVPERAHKRIIDGITQSKPLSVELDLAGDPDHKLFVTIGQKKKIEAAISHGVHRMKLRMSAKQVRHNHKFEGGFLSAMLVAATRFLPAILTGLALMVRHLVQGHKPRRKAMECFYHDGVGRLCLT